MPFTVADLAEGRLIDAFQPAKLIQQKPRVIDGALAGAGIAVSQDNRQQLGFTERLRALGQKFFPRPIFLGPILDGLIRSHSHLVELKTEPAGLDDRRVRLSHPPRTSPAHARQGL